MYTYSISTVKRLTAAAMPNLRRRRYGFLGQPGLNIIIAEGGVSVLSKEVSLCLLFCPACFTYIYLWSAVHHLFELGKSKTRIKKEKKMIPFTHKLLLIGYAERCEYHTVTAKRLCYIYWGYILITLVCIAVWVLSMMFPAAEKLLSICVLVKVLILDIPVNTYGFIMTKHDKKRGGSTWVWTDKD